MGKAILYCFKCSSILREDDFARGKAVRVGDNVACADCAPEVPIPVPELPAKKHVSSARVPAGGRPGSSQSIRRLPDPDPDRRKLLLIGAAGAAVLVVLVILLLSSGNKPAETTSTPVPSPAPPGPRPPADGPDRKALESARAWARSHPQDLVGQLREFQNVVFDHDRTPSAAEAQKEIVRVKAEIRGHVESAMAALEREIQAPIASRDYRSALTIVERAAKRLPYPDWELARTKREHEIRNLIQNEAPLPPPPKGVLPDLVGHWSFNEGSGDVAQDASGNGHTGKLMNGATWAPGQAGTGLRCDGNRAHVQLPSTPLLDKLQAENYTLAAWYKPEIVPPGDGDRNDASHGIVMKRGYHEGLRFDQGGRFLMEHWLENIGKGIGGTWDERYAAGKFYHLVGVVNRPLGHTLIYVDGRLKNTGDWAAGTSSKEYGGEPWRIGVGAPGVQQWGWPAKGVIDEVRMYKRALTAEEIRSLYDLNR